MEKIKALLEYCSTEDNIPLEYYVRELVRLLINEDDLESYLKFLGFYGKSKLSIFKIFSISAYDMTNDGIIIFRQDFEQVFKDRVKDLDLDRSLFKKYKLYLITQAVLHEIEHVKQKKMVVEKIDKESLEYKLVYLTLRHLYEKYPVYLEQAMICEYQDRIESTQFASYNSSPTERLAEIKSYNNMMKIAEEPIIIKSYKEEIEEKKIRGYTEEIVSPTVYFFKNIAKSDIFKTNGIYKDYISYISYLNSFDFYDDDDESMINRSKKLYSLDDRLMYGLPISKDEYNTLVKK